MTLEIDHSMDAGAPVGVFDSGVGGLTVVREIMRQIPNEKIIYFGDTARVPYGSKSKETVTRFSRQIVHFLQTHHVKTIVVACNTVSAYALEELEKEIDIPIIGVVKPGARVASEVTRNGKIGVIATTATISSHIYNQYIEEINPEVTIYEKACPLFVPLVEEGLWVDPVTDEIARRYLTELIDLDVEAGTVTCETGMIFATLEDLVNEKGYSVMHLPSCMTCCTVGGALAHNGIGILSTKYGKMDDMALSLEVVLPNGDIINTLPVPKHSSGPNLVPFFVGSEGTLGVMTKVKFKIVKQPEIRIHHAFLFPDIHIGYQACREIVQAVKPSIVRLFDEAETVSIIKKIIGFAKKGSFLNLTLEGYKKIVDAELEIVLEIAKKYGAEDLGTEYGEKWFQNRITFFYPDHIMDLPQMFGTLDTVATHDNIENIYRAMKAAVEDNFKQYGVRFISHSSHWYDWGAMNYSRFIIDNPPADPEEALRVHNQIWNTGVRAALANGGVLNDHHGVGLKLSRLVREQYGPAIQVLQALKEKLDPNGIMNPYKMGL